MKWGNMRNRRRKRKRRKEWTNDRTEGERETHAPSFLFIIPLKFYIHLFNVIWSL